MAGVVTPRSRRGRHARQGQLFHVAAKWLPTAGARRSVFLDPGGLGHDWKDASMGFARSGGGAGDGRHCPFASFPDIGASEVVFGD